MLIQILWQIKLEECVITSHTYLYCSYSWGFLITPKSLRLSNQYIKAKSVSLHEFAIQCTYVSSQININSSLVRTWAYTLSHWRPEYISYLIFGADVSKSGLLHTYPVLQQTHICHVKPYEIQYGYNSFPKGMGFPMMVYCIHCDLSL